MIDIMRHRHLSQIRMLLGDALIRESPPTEDMERNTDLMVLTAHDKRIACRVRTWRYFESYRGQFTLRCRSRYGLRTEIDKVMDGWGDYMFYGFEDYYERSIAAAVVLDLGVFRSTKTCGEYRKNTDTTGFLAYCITDFPQRLVVASYPPQYWQTGEIIHWQDIKPYMEQISNLKQELAAARDDYDMVSHYVKAYNLDGDTP